MSIAVDRHEHRARALNERGRLVAWVSLQQRLSALCDRLKHPDLKSAAAAASELCSIMHAASHPNPEPHLFYALDAEVEAYKTLTGGECMLQLVAGGVECGGVDTCRLCGVTCTCGATCVSDPTDTLEFRLVELLRRCTAKGIQTALFVQPSGKRKRGLEHTQHTALEDTLRALATHARAPGLKGSFHDLFHDLERNGPITQTQLGQMLVKLLRSDSFLSEEAWANAAICLREATSHVGPWQFWTNHHRSMASLLGWAPQWELFGEPTSRPGERPDLVTHRFRSIDFVPPDDDVLSAADERMITRLLQVARGWPSHGWLCNDAAADALGLLYAMHHTGNRAVRILTSPERDEQMYLMIRRQGRSVAGHGDPVAMESEWHQGDEEDDAEFQTRLSHIPRMLPTALGAPVYEVPDSDSEDDGDGDGDGDGDEARRGLPWDAHPPLLVSAEPLCGPTFECPICLESLCDPAQRHRLGGAKSLHCRCTGRTPYHEVCLRQHLLRSNSCPLCRVAPASTVRAFETPFYGAKKVQKR